MRDSPRRSSTAPSPAAVLAYDIETIAPATDDGAFPPWPLHRPIAVGFARAKQQAGSWKFEIDALVVGGDIDETALLREVDQRIAAAGVTTTYNGRGFDALVLRLAAQRCRLWNLKALADHAAANRYAGEHMDLADLYASYNRKVSLAQICDEVGIPVKTSVSGGDVAALWEAGETRRIRDYVMEDAVATLVLYLAWSAARSADEALITRPLAALARHIEARPELAHLQPFVDCALTRWARPRAMRAELGAALARATARLAREDDERAFTSS